MKLKELERLPYMDPGRFELKKDYKAVARTAEVGGDPHLFIELYGKEDRDTPLFRIVFSGDDYRTYVTADRKWSRSEADNYMYSIPWVKSDERWKIKAQIGKPGNAATETITGFFHDDPADMHGLWTYLGSKMRDMSAERKKGAEAEGKKKMEDLLAHAPGHGEGFLVFAKKMFRPAFLYYLAQDNDVFITCSKCGRRTVLHDVPVFPNMGKKGECPACGEKGEYLKETLMERLHISTKYCYDVQQCGEKGILISYVQFQKNYQIGVPEQYLCEDIAKFWYWPGRKTRDSAYFNIHSGNWQKEVDYRESRRLTKGLPVIEDAPVYNTGLLGKVVGNALRYSGWNRYGKDIIPYMDLYIKAPMLEMIAKSGMDQMAGHLIKAGASESEMGLLQDERKKPWERLGIRQEDLRMLRECHGNVGLWRVLQDVKRHKLDLKEDEILFIHDKIRGFEREDLYKRIKKEGYGKTIRYLTKQDQTLQLYEDYLSMAKDQGLDMARESVLFPRNLEERHNQLIWEKDKKVIEERIVKRRKEYPGIQKDYRRLLKKYLYKDDRFIIRPAESAEEIVMEGFLMNHCVGRTESYTKNHNDGTAFIMLLRKVGEPDRPYCTVEMAPDGTIRQWYQKGDTKTDAGILDPWLKEYSAYIKDKRRAGTRISA